MSLSGGGGGLQLLPSKKKEGGDRISFLEIYNRHWTKQKKEMLNIWKKTKVANRTLGKKFWPARKRLKIPCPTKERRVYDALTEKGKKGQSVSIYPQPGCQKGRRKKQTRPQSRTDKRKK